MDNSQYLDYLLAESMYGFDESIRVRAKSAHANLADHLSPIEKQPVIKLHKAPLSRAQQHKVARDQECTSNQFRRN